MSQKIISINLLSKSICKPCKIVDERIKDIINNINKSFSNSNSSSFSTLNSHSDKCLKNESKLIINYNKISINSSNKMDLIEKYKISDNEVPIVIINDIVFSKINFNENEFINYINNI